ncbi:hypothetical protein O181_089025 [Austropuccinia psidii MF-1]|uniref:Integrase catalytic domain-containing protein n=1 Tax=Austropuccinia psidii MF-1 TaxID=1389203 RepID=A0A9Q3IT03_9BASI|nr:hypothetical protein [Austropuccinia psidii MF-1]
MKAWGRKWGQELSEYINTCERLQEPNRKHGKKYELLKPIEEPKSPWETINMNWVTGLFPGGKENFNAFLVIVDRYTQDVRILDQRLLHGWNKLAFSTAYNPQTNGLAERMILTREDIIRKCFAYGMKYKDHEGYTNDWVTLLPAVQLAYNTSQHSTTGKATSLVDKGWKPLLPVDHLNKNLLIIHPTAKDFHYMWKGEFDAASQCIAEAKEYNKQRYYKTHMEPDFKEGDQVLVSTFNHNNLKGQK